MNLIFILPSIKQTFLKALNRPKIANHYGVFDINSLTSKKLYYFQFTLYDSKNLSENDKILKHFYFRPIHSFTFDLKNITLDI